MKPNEKKPYEVYRIINKKTNEAAGSYSRAYCDEYDFRSVESARGANFHGMFEDKGQYRIAKYRVTYELIEEDCDDAGMDYIPPPPPKTWDEIMEEASARLAEYIGELIEPDQPQSQQGLQQQDP